MKKLLTLPLLLILLAGCSASDTFTSPDGVPIAFEKSGSGDITLVMVHGWSCDRSYWDEQVAHLGEEFTMVTIDLAGHGESGLQRQDYTMQAFGRDVAAVVNGLKLEDVYLVGHSMGGTVVCEAAAILGDKVKGIIGIDTLQAPEFLITPEQVEGFTAPFLADMPGHMVGFVTSMFPANADTALLNHVIKDMGSAPPEIAVSAMKNYLLNDHKATLRKLDVPVWCLCANMWPIDFEAWKFYGPGYTAVVMEGVGHFLHMEAPEDFNKELVDLVDRMENHGT